MPFTYVYFYEQHPPLSSMVAFFALLVIGTNFSPPVGITFVYSLYTTIKHNKKIIIINKTN